MIDFELKELLRKAYKAGRRNALKQDELNFNDFINKHESKLKLFAIPVVVKSVCDSNYDDFDTKDDLYAAGYDGDM